VKSFCLDTVSRLRRLCVMVNSVASGILPGSAFVPHYDICISPRQNSGLNRSCLRMPLQIGELFDAAQSDAPPHVTICFPVMLRAPSLNRKAASAETSSNDMKRSIGWIPTRPGTLRTDQTRVSPSAK